MIVGVGVAASGRGQFLRHGHALLRGVAIRRGLGIPARLGGLLRHGRALCAFGGRLPGLLLLRHDRSLHGLLSPVTQGGQVLSNEPFVLLRELRYGLSQASSEVRQSTDLTLVEARLLAALLVHLKLLRGDVEKPRMPSRCRWQTPFTSSNSSFLLPAFRVGNNSRIVFTCFS